MATATARSRPITTWRRRVRNLPSSPPPSAVVSSSSIPGEPTSAEAEWTMFTWADWAAKQIQADYVERAQTFARQQMKMSEEVIKTGRLEALVIGALAPIEADLPLQAQLEALYWRHLLLELGQALVMMQETTKGARVFGALALRFSIDPSGRRAAAVAAAPPALVRHPAARHFEREVYTHWAQAAQLLGRDPRGVHERAVHRGLWVHRHQRPLDHYVPTLRGKAFWSSSELPAAQALEAAYADILAECRALMSGDPNATFAHYRSRVVTSGGWSDVQFYAGCQKDVAHCNLCPRTAAVIASQPRLNSVIFGSHFFSRLVGGTHLSAHCGPSNFRLRCHLGLIVPPGVRIRVGDEIREWRAGECLIFDDSFEHEVWHEGADDRVVLICDMWHPDLDLHETVHPLLSDKQMEAMRQAQAGTHQPLQQRTYSTGENVVRSP